MNLLKLKLKGQGLVVLLFFMLTACNHWGFPTEAEKGSGKMVSVKIGAINVAGRSQNETITRAAGSEKRIVGQPVIQDLGGGMLAEITVEEEVSALRDDPTPKKLADGVKFRVIAIKHSDQTYLSHADFTVGSASKPSIYVPDNVECDFVCYSYNNADVLPGWSNGDLSALSVDNSKDLLWGKEDYTLSSGGRIVTNDTELKFTLSQQFTKVTLKLNGNGKTITNIADNSISLNAASSGNFNLAKGEFSSSGSINFSGWSGYNSTEVTSGTVTFIPQAKYTFFFAAEAISWEDNATTGKTTEGPIGSFQFKFDAGSSYTVTLTILRLPRFAGSNIYWDGSQLTFDPYGINNDHAKYQGVYFRWGSLIGISPVGDYSDDTSTGTVLYWPDNIDNRTWKSVTGGTAWGGIPSYAGETFSSDLTGESAHTLLKKPDFTKYKGDICNYINKDYRMPTAAEFDAFLTAHGGYSLTNGGYSSSNITSSNAAGTQVFDPYATINGVIFPASGYRKDSSGTLGDVGNQGRYWSGSAYSGSSAYHLYFSSSDAGTNYPNGGYGRSVRCVKIE